MPSKRWITTMSFLVAAMWLDASCNTPSGDMPKARFERTIELEQALGSGSALAVSTTSGSIEVAGQETDRVHVVATVVARAATKEQARDLAEQVSLRLEQTADGLGIRIDKPDPARRRFISISYEVTVPRQTGIDCSSASGSVNLADLTGEVSARTASGSVEATGIAGTIHLHSSSGSITCDRVDSAEVHLESASGAVRLTNGSALRVCQLLAASGPVTARRIEADSLRMASSSSRVTLNDAQAEAINLHAGSGSVTAGQVSCERLQAESTSGDISVAFRPDAPGDVAANVKSSTGSVRVVVPRDFAGQVDLRASSGTVRMSKPVAVTSKPGRNYVRGTVGDGAGSLLVRSGSGAIRIR